MDRMLVERPIQGDEDSYAGLMAIAGDRLLAIAFGRLGRREYAGLSCDP